MSLRFSGHETFACRYAWLPKAYRAITHDPAALADDESAMMALGIGRNMLQALRFWVEVTGVAVRGRDRSFNPTPFGTAILHPGGLDPYLEDIRTLWLLHWNIASQPEPLFAWDYLLNRWQQPELVRSEVLDAFVKATDTMNGKTLSPVTLAQHLDVFLHTYLARDRERADEEGLDCLLAELQLLQRVGERRVDGKGRREAVFAFRRERKPEITPAVFAYALNEFWRSRRNNEQTLTFRDVAVAAGSVGQVFKLPEDDLRERLERLEHDTGGVFIYRESATQQMVIRGRSCDREFLEAVYA
jgi:uncharacterized protein DUF4007